MYDVVIVGARCAGSPLGMLLAKAGHNVLIVDRASFPSDTMSTHFIQIPGMLFLTRWGLLDPLLATGCPPIKVAYFDVNGDEMEFPIPVHGPIEGLYSPRRTILDKLLVDAAAAQGAEVQEGVSVDSLLFENDRVVGIKGHNAEGDFEARARFVVGADGRHSIVAREVGAHFEREVEPLTSGYYSYFRNTGIERTQVIMRDEVVSIMFPTHHDLAVVAVIWPRDRFGELRRDIETHFNAGLASLGDQGQAVLQAERVEKFIGAADLANYLRRTSGPGWALVGDACYHKDPIPADGITDAFRGADMLATALDATLSGKASEEEVFERYAEGYRNVADKHLDPAVRSARFDLTPKERFDAFIESRLTDQAEAEEMLAEDTVG